MLFHSLKSVFTVQLVILLLFYPTAKGQYYNTNFAYNTIQNVNVHNRTATWCTISDEEQRKCQGFSQAIDRDISQFSEHYISLKCKKAFNKEDCMNLLDQEEAHLTTLDPGEVFIAGRYHSIIPIMQEIYDTGVNYQYAVAVIKKNTLTDVNSINDLRGKKACFAGVGTLAGWTTPLYTLIQRGGMEVIDCNNHIKSTSNFFGPSCAVNSLIDRYNPLGDNSDQLCKLCIGEIPGGRCTNSDPYSGYEGAFRCLVEAGEIAFLVHTTVQEMTSTNFDFNSITKDQFELLCDDGSKRSIDDYQDCNWGKVPSRAIVVSSATDSTTRQLYQRFLEKSVKIFGGNMTIENKNDNNYNKPRYDSNDNNYNNDDYNREFRDNSNRWNSNDANQSYYYNRDNSYDDINPPGVQPLEIFNLFESAPKYGRQHNLLFSDAAKDFVGLVEKFQTYSHYLGHAENSILGVRRCTVHSMKLCVTSEPEMEKCIKMRDALKAQILKPELVCYKGHSHIRCMQSIRNGEADVAVLDASDVYTAGLRFGLVPIMSEKYNLETPEYYVVAVAKESDPTTDLTYLKNKYTCHTGINTAAGWVYPLAYLLSNGWIRGYGCDSVRAAAEYFIKSCVPGALSTEYNVGLPYDNMCDLCHGVSYRYCRRDASEDYFGHTGAFRCLVEGGGDVAFTKHTTVAENTNGKRRETWARNTFVKDFQLLCPDGTRRASTDYENCNLGKVKANAIVARPGYNDTEINAYINLFIYAQQFYGRKETDEFSFSMFHSPPPYSDLIFQDAAQQLIVVPPEKREFSRYLGPDFMRARRIVDCNAGAAAISYSLFASLLTIFLTFILGR